MHIQKVNIHQIERLVSAALGGVLLFRSLTRRSRSGTLLGSALLYRGISGHSYLYQALHINTADRSQQREGGGSDAVTEVVRSITIGKPAGELYRFWLEPEHLSQIMGDVAEVTPAGELRSHWVMHAPFQRRIEWDTQLLEDYPDRLIRWRSVEGALLPHECAMHFRSAPGDWGTEVTLRIRFDPPGGMLGNRIMKRLDRVPAMLAEKALRRFKSLVETGEAPTLKHNPSARAMASV